MQAKEENIKTVATLEELVFAIENNETQIIIKGELAKKIYKIKTVKKKIWIAVMSAIAMGVVVAVSTSGLAFSAALPVVAPAVAVLGAGTTFVAVKMARKSKLGKEILNELRNSYKIENGGVVDIDNKGEHDITLSLRRVKRTT